MADRPRLPIGLMAIGSEMAGFTVVGVGLDYAFKTLPLFTIGLTVLGFVISFYHLIRFARDLSRSPPPGPGGEGDS